MLKECSDCQELKMSTKKKLFSNAAIFQGSISQTFCAQLFRAKVSRAALLYLNFRHNNIGRKAAQKNVGEIDWRMRTKECSS